jgi:pilus assembly protein CpaF
MVSVTITEKGGKPQAREFDQAEISIGRVQGNDIVLPKSNISKRHARIVINGNSAVVIDAKSTNGTYISGKRLGGPTELRPNDKVYIGDFTLEVHLSAAASHAAPHTKELHQPSYDRPSQGADDDSEGARDPFAEALSDDADPDVDDPQERAAEAEQEAIRRVQAQLNNRPDLPPGRASAPQAAAETSMGTAAGAILQNLRQKGELPAGLKEQQIVEAVVSENLGLGPLEPLLADPTIAEIMVNSAQQIYVERAGKLERSRATFSSNAAVVALVERIAHSVGRIIDKNFPMVDARLRDGSRVNAVLPPLSLRGPVLTIRKFSREALQIDDLIAFGSVNADMGEFLEVCVQARKNIIISGGTGSGKTTLLNVVSSFISTNERIVTIEDAAELKLDQDHVISLEARPAGIDGKGAITIRDLVRNSLRMRPDRIIVGECRGGEALDMLQAMNTGHDGSLTTVHANSPRDALSRLETMVLMAGMDLPLKAIREQIQSAVDIIVQQTRFADGSRRIVGIAEVVGMESEVISMHDLFTFEQQGINAEGRLQGRFKSTGIVPKFYEPLRALGLEPNLSIFRRP